MSPFLGLLTFSPGPQLGASASPQSLEPACLFCFQGGPTQWAAAEPSAARAVAAPAPGFVYKLGAPCWRNITPLPGIVQVGRGISEDHGVQTENQDQWIEWSPYHLVTDLFTSRTSKGVEVHSGFIWHSGQGNHIYKRACEG